MQPEGHGAYLGTSPERPHTEPFMTVMPLGAPQCLELILQRYVQVLPRSQGLFHTISCHFQGGG